MSDAALAAGADDYLHRPFTRSELLARARAGLRAAQQRSDDRLVRALMVNVPGAIYRSAWHDAHRLELISDEIERISGYPPANFIASEKRTLLSIVHPDDRDGIIASVANATDDGRPFVLEYRIVRADGGVRWVLDRGQLVPGHGGRLWMDGAIFDITERRATEEALRRREIEEARTEELRASRVRIVQAADAARRKIERDLHDGAQQRLVALALDVSSPQAGRARARVGGAVARAPGQRARRGVGRAARAGPRHPPRRPHRARPGAGGHRPRRPRAGAGRDPRAAAGRLPTAAETTAYFTVAEALTNVAKYAQATRATVRLAAGDDTLVVEICDDGVGGARRDHRLGPQRPQRPGGIL